MGIDSVNNSSASNINSNTNIDKVEENSVFGKISDGSSSFGKPDLDVKNNVKEGGITGHSTAEVPGTVKTEDAQNTAEVKKTSSGGMFGGFKLGAGKPSGAMKGAISDGGNIKDRSLENRI
jgi:hypothetical protein